MTQGIANPVTKDEMIVALSESFTVAEAGRRLNIDASNKVHRIVERLGIENPRYYLRRKSDTSSPEKVYQFRDVKAAVARRDEIQLPAEARKAYWARWWKRWTPDKERAFKEALRQGVIV